MRKEEILLWLIVLLIAGCTQATASNVAVQAAVFTEPLSNAVEVHDHNAHEHDQPHEHLDETTATTTIAVVLVPSELTIGQNRMAVGLLDSNKQMIHDAEVHFHYFDLANPSAPMLEQEANAYRVQSPDGLTTIFAQDRSFDRAGAWGLEVQARLADGQTAVQRIKFTVATESNQLLPGDAAPRLQTPALADVDGDFSQITSAWEPDPALHQLSLDEALANGKPTVLLLATPAFCQTRFCGPAYEIASDLTAQVDSQANVLQLEVYSGLPDPSQTDWQLSPVMSAFGLTTEPWVYVMDGDGEIVYRAEGLFSLDEIVAYLP